MNPFKLTTLNNTPNANIIKDIKPTKITNKPSMVNNITSTKSELSSINDKYKNFDFKNSTNSSMKTSNNTPNDPKNDTKDLKQKLMNLGDGISPHNAITIQGIGASSTIKIKEKQATPFKIKEFDQSHVDQMKIQLNQSIVWLMDKTLKVDQCWKELLLKLYLQLRGLLLKKSFS